MDLIAAKILIGKIVEIKNSTLYCEGYTIKRKRIDFLIQINEIENSFTPTKQKNNIGDIVLLSNNHLTTLFYSNSKHNAFFVTEKCNNNCLMCSQPPKMNEDTDTLFIVNQLLLELITTEIDSIGITGGEPTLFFNELITLIKKTIDKLPNTSIQILTNGRLFNNFEKVKQLAAINNGNIILGIPLHSDVFFEHDYIAQAHGSFYQTMKGLYKLTSYDIKVEIRIVINKQNYKRLNSIADFIYKDLPFVEHIAFMGLEYIGNAIENLDLIDISPYNYAEDLANSVLKLKRWGLNVSIYNIPLCMIKPTVYEFAKKSISDWKLKYLPSCEQCVLKNECCGLFATSKVINNVIPFN